MRPCCGMLRDTLAQLRNEPEPTCRKNMLNCTLDLLRSAKIDNVPLALMTELRGASVMAPWRPVVGLGLHELL